MLKSKLKQIILLLGDLGLFYASLYLALMIRTWSRPENDLMEKNLPAFAWVFLIWLLALYIAGLYDLKNFNNRSRLTEKYLHSLVPSVLLSITFFYIFSFQNVSPKTNLALFAVIFSISFLLWRFLFSYLLKNQIPKNNLGIIGFNPRVPELIDYFKGNPQLGYNVKFIVSGHPENINDHIKNILPIYGPGDKLEELAYQHKINNFIVAQNLNDSPDISRQLFNCLPLNISFISFSNFYEKITGRVPLEIIEQTWFLENLNLADKQIFEFVKRIIDLTIGTILLIISLPFWLILAVVIKLESAGPILFSQLRIGANNIPFKIYKFRTMTESNNDRALTVENDKRITGAGRFLRKTRMDEIPQVINIIKGHMSFIGPRPERPEFTAELSHQIPFFEIRTLIKPGLTGWDQISGEYHSPMKEDTIKKLQYDLFYIKNRSLYLDATIFLKTIKAILNYKGR
jgi:exopolysaccharide biosynthesis polyprenyl glycosylphosphotransferase